MNERKNRIKKLLTDKLNNIQTEYKDNKLKDKNSVIVETKIDNFLTEDENINQVKTLLKRCFAKCMASNDMNSIRKYSSIMPICCVEDINIKSKISSLLA